MPGKITITADTTGLLEAAREIMPNDLKLIGMLEVRVRVIEIRKEFAELKKQMPSGVAVETLAIKYYLSVKAIESYIYGKNSTTW